MKTKRTAGMGYTLGCMVLMGVAAPALGAPTNGDEIAFRSIDDTSYVIHSFTTVGTALTFTAPNALENAVHYLIVAGGGPGGRAGTTSAGGGGGGGGVLHTLGDEFIPPAPVSVTGAPYNVAVGAGGTGTNNGANSSFYGQEAIGGGAGGEGGANGSPGGSGGGGGGQAWNPGTEGGDGTAGQGYGGGGGLQITNQAVARAGGGGGGAAQLGQSAAGSTADGTAKAGDGGEGLALDITGSIEVYGSGGGGGARSGVTLGPGIGGTNAGDGGWFQDDYSQHGSQGLDGYGGGGGGSAGGGNEFPSYVRAPGGSGVVIVRYALNDVTSWDGGNGYYAVNGNVGRLLAEDAVALRVLETDTLTITADGRLTVGTGSSLTIEENASATVASGAVLGGGGVVYGGLTLANGAMLAFDPGTALTVHGHLDLGNLSIASLVGLTEEVALGSYTLIAGASDSENWNWNFSGVLNWGEENAEDIGGGKFAYFEEGSLKLVVIPEPHTLGLLLAAGALLALRRRGR